MFAERSSRPRPAVAANRRLDSWNTIADYLKAEVRFVQRWEKERGLPVFRLPGSRRGVSAYSNDLDAWLRAGNDVEPVTVPPSPGQDGTTEQSFQNLQKRKSGASIRM